MARLSAGGYVQNVALLFEDGLAVTRDSEQSPLTDVVSLCLALHTHTHTHSHLLSHTHSLTTHVALSLSASLPLLYSSTYVFPVPVGP